MVVNGLSCGANYGFLWRRRSMGCEYLLRRLPLKPLAALLRLCLCGSAPFLVVNADIYTDFIMPPAQKDVMPGCGI